MNILSILKNVGTGILSATPYGALAIPVINALLPDESKLPNDVTGVGAQTALATLRPEQRQKIELAEIDLLIEEERGRTARYEAMAASDGQETRAILVKRAMNALIWLSVLFAAATAYVYSTKGAEAAFSLEMAGVYITITGTFTYVVRAYSGDLRTEAKSRHRTIDEKPEPLSAVSAFIASKFK